MLADDRPPLPMRFGIRMTLRGQLDVRRFHDAFQDSIVNQPLYCATVSRGPRAWYWQALETGDGSDNQHPGWREPAEMRWDFDLAIEPGIRVGVTPSQESTEVWVLVHHSCSDARGTLKFLSDWFARYDGNQQTPPRESGSARQLPDRAMGPNRPRWHYLFPFGKRWQRLWKFYANPIKPLRFRQSPIADRNATSEPSFLSRKIKFCQDGWNGLKSELPSGSTMNDVILAITFAAIKDWNQSNGARPERDWIRIAMPIDVASTRSGIATNGTSMVFLDRRADRIESVETLIPDVAEETRKIKRYELGFVFTDVLRMLNAFPGGMKLGLMKSFACTTVVSNLGVLKDLHLPTSSNGKQPMKLDGFDFLVPVRKGTAAAVGIVTHEQTLHLCLNYDPRQLPTESAQQFFEGLGNLLEDFLQR